jgi:hypothetical protein
MNLKQIDVLPGRVEHFTYNHGVKTEINEETNWHKVGYCLLCFAIGRSYGFNCKFPKRM